MVWWVGWVVFDMTWLVLILFAVEFLWGLVREPLWEELRDLWGW
jgi:hypothetical protein